MAIIYSYPTVTPTADDLVLGTDVNQTDKPTKNFTIQSIVDIVQGGAAGLGATIKLTAPLGDASDPATGANQPIVNLSSITGTGTASFAALTDGTATIQAGVGTGFSAFTSTAITGTLQTAAQPNVTSLGTLTSLDVDGNVSGNAVETTIQGFAFATDTNIASALNIKNYVLTNPGGAESLAATLLVGNTTGATKIEVDHTAGGIDFIDDAKLRLGTGDDFEMYHANADNKTYLKEAGASDLEIWSNKVAIKNAAGNEALLNATENAAVELYYDNVKRFETLTAGAKVTGAFEATTTGTFAGVINSGAYTDSSGDVGSAGQVLKSTVTGTNWVTDAPLYTWTIEADSGAGSPYAVASGDTIDFVGGDNINTSWINAAKELKIDVTGVVQKGTGAATQVAYWTDADTIAGDAGMVYDSANNNLTVSGTVQAGTLSDGTFSGTSGTYTGGVSITSTTFVGALTGNADTATALAATGSIGFGGDVTLSSAAPSATYTSGGNITFNLGLVNSAVTGQVLTGLPTPAAASIVASDTILEAFGKTQSQINSIANGLQYQGTWNATTNSPTLASGGGEATSGTTTATTANKLVDSGANFTATVTVGDKVINQVDGQTALVSNVDSATTLSIDADIMLTGEAYTIDNTPFITQGHYYVVSVAGPTALNGISDWVVGDWVIAGATNVWEKLDNTAVQGTGTANYLTKWNATGVSAIVDSGVTDDGSTIKLLNDVELGASATDTTLVKGPATFDENVRFDKSISIGAAYGTAGQVFTSGGGAGAANTWTNISSWGYVESVTGLYGITIGGTAVDPTVAITSDVDNLINQAAVKATPIGADSILINDSAATNTLKKATLTSIKTFTAESWLLDVDGGTAATIADGDQVGFNSGTGIIQTLSTKDVGTAIRYEDENANPATGAKNFIDETATVTPVATDFLAFSDQFDTSTKNVVKKATIATIVALGDQGLPAVLAIDNTSGANDIVMADSQKVTFGTVPDLQIFHDGTGNNSHIQTTSGSAGDLLIESQGSGHDLYLRAADDIFIQPQGSENGIKVIGDGAVELYYDNSKKFETTSTGIGVTGQKITLPGLAGGIMLDLGTTNFNPTIQMNGNSSNIVHAPNGNVVLKSDTVDTIRAAVGSVYFDQYAAGNKTGVSVYNLEIDQYGKVIETPSQNPGGKAGTYNGSKGYTGTTAASLFTLKRTTTGQLIFDVYLTSGTAGGTVEKYVVAHKSNTAPVYNKVIGLNGTPDFTVAFTNATTTDTGDSVLCTITPTNSQTINYTVQVGYDNSGAVSIA